MSTAEQKAWKDDLRTEIATGGSEPPCPFCGNPRVRRSDYIRCPRCAMNWINGEALDRDPRQQRLEKFLAGHKATCLKSSGGKK